MAVRAGGLRSILHVCNFPVLEERESAVVGGINSLAVAALRDPNDDRILELAARAVASVVAYHVQDLADGERFGVDVRELGVLQ